MTARRRNRPVSEKGRPNLRVPLQPLPRAADMPWGQPDRVLAEAICRQWLPTMMPSTPWTPEPRVRISDRARSACGWCIVAALAVLALALLGARANGAA